MTNPQPSLDESLENILDAHAEYYILQTAKFFGESSESPELSKNNESDMKTMGRLTAYISKQLAKQREDIRNRLPKLLNLKHTETEEEYVGKEWYNQALEDITKILDGDKEL